MNKIVFVFFEKSTRNNTGDKTKTKTKTKHGKLHKFSYRLLKFSAQLVIQKTYLSRSCQIFSSETC